jgi:hypothetical protein
MEEVWKEIDGYEGLYQVSSLGKVFSLRNTKNIKLNLSEKGYFRVDLWKENKRNSLRVHRLVAKSFIDNPDNKPQVNHIDGIKTNNNINNLEWSTPSENVRHAISLGLKKTSYLVKTMLSERMSIPVIDTSSGKIYKSITEASKSLQVSHQYLSKMLKGDLYNKTKFKYLK